MEFYVNGTNDDFIYNHFYNECMIHNKDIKKDDIENFRNAVNKVLDYVSINPQKFLRSLSEIFEARNIEKIDLAKEDKEKLNNLIEVITKKLSESAELIDEFNELLIKNIMK